MSAKIDNVSFDTFAEAAKDAPKQRGMPRNSMPLREPVRGDVDDIKTAFEVSDERVRVIVSRDTAGADAANALADSMFGVAGESVPESKKDDEDEDDATPKLDHRDGIVWTRQSGEPHFEVRALEQDRVAIIVCADEVTETMIAELAITLVRVIVAPFSDHETRAAWKAARRPKLEVVCDWEPAPGDFDVPVARRLESLLKGANKRVDAMYDAVFKRKVLSTARSAAMRWSKKAGIAKK